MLYLLLPTDVHRHRLSSRDYIKTLRCHERGREFESRRPRHIFNGLVGSRSSTRLTASQCIDHWRTPSSTSERLLRPAVIGAAHWQAEIELPLSAPGWPRIARPPDVSAGHSPRNRNPANPVSPTLLGPPELKLASSNMGNWGSPLAPVITKSGGPGRVDGIGSGDGRGIGPGNGSGLGPGYDWGFGDKHPRSGEPGGSDVVYL